MRQALSALGMFAVLAIAMATAAAQDATDADVVAAIETRASVMVERGARSEAVHFLQTELATYGGAPIHDQIRALVDRVSLEGRPAPRLETRLRVGPRVPSVADLKGKVVVLFFWAHWCPECKAESPSVGKLLDKYRSQGLAIVAPTQRYGYVEGGRPAAPDRELRYIIQVRDTHYGFLRDVPVPVAERTSARFERSRL